MLHIPPTIYHTQKTKSHTKEPNFLKMEVKRGQENGPKAEKDDRKSNRTRQKNKRRDIYYIYNIIEKRETSELLTSLWRIKNETESTHTHMHMINYIHKHRHKY